MTVLDSQFSVFTSRSPRWFPGSRVPWFPLLAFTLRTLLFTTAALGAAGCGSDAQEPARKGKWIDMDLGEGKVIQTWVSEYGLQTVPELRDWPTSENPPAVPESGKDLPQINLDPLISDSGPEQTADRQDQGTP